MDEEPFTRLRDAATSVFGGGGVLFAYLFGSVATGRMHPHSDVDVAVYIDPAERARDSLALSLDIAARLSGASGVGAVEVVVLNDAPLRLRGRAVQERRVLFSRDEPTRVEYESRTLREFFDYQIHAGPRDEALLREIAEGRR